MRVHAEKIKKEFIRKGKDSNVFAAVETCSPVLEAGTLTVVTGRSGSGKSTLLNMLAGILAPTEGTVYYDERDLYAMGDEELSRFRNEHIGFIPQGKSAISSLTVLENVCLPDLLYGEPDEKKAMLLMERFGIADLARVMPDELSGGEQRRMAIARALMKSPQVLFADEPTGDLDDENTELVFRTLKETAAEGCAVLMVTHEADAVKYADRCFRMDAGVLTEVLPDHSGQTADENEADILSE